MDRCGTFQAQLLDSLYDLLEPEQEGRLREHLGGCAACQAALEKARGQQRLLAAAAKLDFTGVQFVPPIRRVAAEPARPPASSPRRDRAWGRWAVAAAVLVAVGGVAIPVARQVRDGGDGLVRYAHASEWHNRVVAEGQKRQQAAEAALAHSAAETKRLRLEDQQLPAEFHRERDHLLKERNERQLDVRVTGPEVLIPGRRNDYRIHTTDLTGQAVAADVTVRLVDEAKGKVLEEPAVVAEGPGTYCLALRPDVPYYPDARLSLEVVARKEGVASVPLSGPVKLGKPLYVTHLTTDKPLYQPGEWVRFRSLTLERFSLRPPPEDFHLVYEVRDPTPAHSVVYHQDSVSQLADANDPHRQAIPGPDGKPLRGIGAGQFWIDPDKHPGGEYTLTVREAGNRFPAQERKFKVNRYEPPRFNKELEFGQKSYGAGQEVLATARASQVEGGALANRPVKVTVKVDDRWYDLDGKGYDQPRSVEQLRTDDKGEVRVRFKLPAQIERGDATLAVEFTDGGSVETVVRPVPVVLKKLNVEFFPEGGELVAGVRNRVYFQVRTPLDRPADLRGRVLDQDGNVAVPEVQTLTDNANPGVNQGLGVFEIKPAAGRTYRLHIDEPIGIEARPELPPANADGVALTIPGGVTGDREPLRVFVRSDLSNRKFWVGAYCRGRLIDHQPLRLGEDDEALVELKPAPGVGGVFRVTVFEERPGDGRRPRLVPVAERLVYRRPSEQLLLNVQADKDGYVPGDKVRLGLEARNEREESTPAVVLLAVVDKRVLMLADDKTERTMPTHFFLSPEVKGPEDLEYADFLLTDHPQAGRALDLLLGTQGWRRFAEQDAKEFLKKTADDGKARAEAERLLVLNGQSPADQHSIDLWQQAQQRLALKYDQKSWRLHQELATRAEEAEREQQAARRDLERLAAEATTAREQTRAAAVEVQSYEDWVGRLRRVALPALGVLLALAAAGAFVVALRRSVARAVPYYAATAVCAVLLVAVALLQVQGRVTGGGDLSWPAALSKANDKEAPAILDAFAQAEGTADRATGPVPPTAPAPGGVPWADAPVPGKVPPFDPGAARKGGPEAMPDRGPGAGREDKNYKGDAKDQEKALREQRRDEALMLRADDPARGRGDWMERNLKLAKNPEEQDGVRPGKDADKKAAPRAMRRPGDMGLGKDGRFLDEEARVVVREYAHRRQSLGSQNGVRSDFTETVYWHPALVLTNGRLDGVAFDLSDSVTTYQVTAFGHTPDGRVGAATAKVQARLPFTLEPKLPLEVTAGDKIDVPLSVANNTKEARPVEVRVRPTGLELEQGKPAEELRLDGGERARRVFRFKPTVVEGEIYLEFDGEARPFAADKVRKSLKVVPEGFPVTESKSDLLEGAAQAEVVLPETWVNGTLRCQVQVYPSTLADLQKGLEALLREPHGCFEQTSTSNYPNLLILDYLKETEQNKPEVEQRARDLLARGYDQLTKFECTNPQDKKQGYEWFGGRAPAHEALTAYGLLQFRDMARVAKVDADMVERTRQYLLNQKDGRGGFKRNPRALDTFGRAPDHVTNAYIVWALTESGDDDVDKELAALVGQAKDSKDPYFLALVANGLLNRSKSAEAVALLKRLADAQKPDGHLEAAQTSITGSGGRDLQVETTALAVLAWLKRPEFNAPAQKAVKWLGQQRGGSGGFGSTQSTILALKALIGYARANKRTPQPGEVSLFVGNDKVATLGFPANVQDALTLTVPEVEKHLKPGKNAVRVEVSGNNVFPYTLSWTYRTLKPPSAENCPVRLETKLDRQQVAEGDLVNLTVTLQNASADKGHGMALAVVGLPAGLTLPEDLKQFEDLTRLRDGGQKAGLISHYELRGRELVLYWRDLAPGQKIEVPLRLVARVPGEYRGPASRAYLYYNADPKCWVNPLEVTIRAKAD